MESRRVIIMSLLIALVVFSSVFAQSTGDTMKLQLRLEEGKTYTLKMVTEQKISQEVQGMNIDATTIIGFGYLFDAEKVNPDGTISVKITHDSVQFKIESAMVQLDYDSENPTDVDNPMVKIFAAFAGESYVCKIASDGEVIEVTGVEEMMASVLKKMDLPEGPEGETTKKGLEDQFGHTEDNMKSMFAFYPVNPVGIGDSWTKSINI